MTTVQSETTHREKHVAHPAFKADEQFAAHLQQLLVDLTDLALQGKQAHWNVVGPNFRDMHLQLDEIVDAAREFGDDIAERMRATYVVPDGSAARVAKDTTLPPFPTGEVAVSEVVDRISASLYAVVGTARRIHDEVDAADPTTADMLHEITERLEQLAWFVDAENRTAGHSVPASIIA
ncbi:DNA starvation/stationary phase protection protein [Nocardioides panacisoli]|uniref:Dps family protein n=1 Tax=Nocardioides panacisoli TaxID=627624 RepID=UPI001C630948|nr:DNA starvation/stationary phase protection protein [Nocardioides panacisoli]QYJ03407.1 DNA starvation/stationary phase protection protein [Nocardioides panacisoli]